MTQGRRRPIGRLTLIIAGAAVLVLLAVALVHGVPGLLSKDGFSDVAAGQQVTDSELRWKCQAADNPDDDVHCAAVGLIDSIQNLWSSDAVGPDTPTPVVFFRGTVQSACQQTTHAGLPFYCHTDRTVYIDLDFYESLDNRLAAGFVLAHVYAHSRQPGTLSGAASAELQADCQAGAWASHATLLTTVTGQPVLPSIGQDDINAALDAAGRLDGLDNLPPIEELSVGGQIAIVPRQQLSHTTPEQRRQALTTGLGTGLLKKCRTTGY